MDHGHMFTGTKLTAPIPFHGSDMQHSAGRQCIRMLSLISIWQTSLLETTEQLVGLVQQWNKTLHNPALF